MLNHSQLEEDADVSGISKALGSTLMTARGHSLTSGGVSLAPGCRHRPSPSESKPAAGEAAAAGRCRFGTSASACAACGCASSGTVAEARRAALPSGRTSRSCIKHGVQRMFSGEPQNTLKL